MTSALEQSLKKRLQLISKERNLAPAEVWQNVITERFLVRLCQSPYHSHFVLKGGMLLARHINIGRETRDLDFSIQSLKNDTGLFQKILRKIAEIQIDDGFMFTNPIVTPLEHFHMQYSGVHVKMEVYFGKVKFPLFIDLGFGDLVKVCKQKILLLSNSKGPLFESFITLRCYPVEFVFAEKLETVIYRGADNSRMKDFHDLHTLACAEKILNGEETENAIRAVFKHRKTPLQLPVQFDPSAMAALQRYWGRYRQTAAATAALPIQIEQVIEMINKWLNVKTDLY